MKIIGKQLYTIQWNSDFEINITTGYQIEAIKHSEKKWYGGEPQIKILRCSTQEDIIKYEYTGEPFLCPNK